MVNDGRLSDLVPEFVCRLLYRLDDNTTNGDAHMLPLRLEDLDAPESVFGRVMSDIKDEIRRQSALDRRCHNAKSVINQLPVEVLGYIFAEILPHEDDSTSGRERNRQLLTLSYICTHWNKVVLGTLELWSYISFRESAATIQTYLDKSKNHPLTIECLYSMIPLYSHTNPREKSAHFRSFLDLTLPHFSRCNSAKLWSIPPEYVHCIEEAQCPMLQSLHIECEPGISDRFLNVLGGRAPMLRELVMHNVAPLGTSSVLRNLTSLSLGYLYDLKREATHNLRLLLSNACQLQRLHFISVYLANGDDEGFTAAPLSLPALESLALDYNSARFYGSLLDIINASRPILLHFRTKSLTLGEFCTFNWPCDPLRMRSVWRYVPKQCNMTLTVSAKRFELIASPIEPGGGSCLKLDVFIGNATLADMLKEFVGFMKGGDVPAPKSLAVEIGKGIMLGREKEWLARLAELPSFVSLRLDGYKAIAPLVRMLDTLQDTTEWYLPRLESLTLVGNCPARILLTVLRRRSAERTPDSPEGPGHTELLKPPTRLSHLSVTDVDITIEDVQELRSLLGASGVLQWRTSYDGAWHLN